MKTSFIFILSLIILVIIFGISIKYTNSGTGSKTDTMFENTQTSEVTASGLSTKLTDAEKNEIAKFADKIQLESPLPKSEVSFPFEISGAARGYWFFEGSFAVTLVDANGKVLVETFAQSSSDWLTTDFVGFKTTLDIKKATSTSQKTPTNDQFPPAENATSSQSKIENVFLLLKRENPSADPANNQTLTIPLYLKR